MAILYEYVCKTCKDDKVSLEENQPDGTITLFRTYANRDDAATCQTCEGAMERSVVPDGFTTWWIDGKSSRRYPILEGPSVNVSLRKIEADRKKARNESRRHFAPLSSEQAAVLKADSARAPKASEVPSPGVTTVKGS